MNSSTVLVSWYEYERVEDRVPLCRGCVGGCRNDSLVSVKTVVISANATSSRTTTRNNRYSEKM
jgi:hypothetical protein